jgi:hypothetical protein
VARQDLVGRAQARGFDQTLAKATRALDENAAPGPPGPDDVTSGSPARADVRNDAFARWVVREIPVLLRVATSLTCQPADAEDLVQDTLIRAYSAVDRFDGEHPRAWLLTILRNTHVNRARRRLPVLFREPDTEVERPEPVGQVVVEQPDRQGRRLTARRRRLGNQFAPHRLAGGLRRYAPSGRQPGPPR